MSAPRLSRQALASLPDAVARPGYATADLTTGIGHLGLGAFARAHLASYTEPLLNDDPSWGICGVSLRSPAVRDALAPQDWLYLRAERDGSGEKLCVMGALTDAMVATDDPPAVVTRLAHASVRIVTISVSEKGYHRRAADGALDETDPAVLHDLADPDATPASRPSLYCVVTIFRRTAPRREASSCASPNCGRTISRAISPTTFPSRIQWSIASFRRRPRRTEPALRRKRA